MSSTRDRIPGHLRQYVVEQDYAAYDEIDHAVWRFVLLQMYARLCETAHPAYVDGLAQTGIDVERIPRIAEMDRCLSDYGWGAVAVDGFIPPRAFQELQALGILPIAADIRRPENLAYTPAPDVIHESAGHAPIIPDPGYRAYLQRSGEVGARAFSSPGDRRVYEAIHLLSELKERAGTSAEEIERAERVHADAEASIGEPSEAALLSRLHWWTVEYGLVGTLEDYQIYGAGLLSSLGESHFCQRPEVRKLPLDARCIEVPYDITQPQPQLFVAPSFDALSSVLEEVASRLAQRCGGALALGRALESGELATVELDSGLQLTGVLSRVAGSFEEPAWLVFAGPCSLARDGCILPGQGSAAHRDGFLAPFGRLADGSALSARREHELPRQVDLQFRSGVRITGRRVGVHVGPDQRVLVVTLEECRVWRGAEVLLRPEQGRFQLPVGERVAAAFAGPADPRHLPETAFSTRRIPVRRSRRGEDARLLALYRRALRLWDKPESRELVPGFEEIGEALCAEFPDDWLLRWNLLESLCKTGRGAALGDQLRRQLLEIERRFPADAPVSTGLRFLDERYPSSSP